MVRVADLNEFSRQRGGKDCGIAAVSTITGKSYDEVARAFEGAITADGINPFDFVLPALSLGWAAAPMITRECPNADDSGLRLRPTSDQIKSKLPGRKAVIGYSDPEVGPHSLAWDGMQATDCSNAVIVPLEDVTLTVVIIFSELPPTQ
jgi:hypothetical protein